MVKESIILLLIILTLYSCNIAINKQFERDIIGEWSFSEISDIRLLKGDVASPPPPFNEIKNGYIFYENKSCENKRGYINRINAEERDSCKLIYFGNKTTYKIEKDSLKILDLVTNIWQSQKIYAITKDTLILEISDSIFEKYIRPKYNINSKETYDKIIVSSSGCFGTCPILDISIDKNGYILFFGERHNTVNGFYSSKITPQDFQSIIRNFQKAAIVNLKTLYDAGWTDDETISVSLIKNRKIIKTISDYGREAPSEFIWAYTPVRFLYQYVKLAPIKKGNSASPMLLYMNFEQGQKICRLSKSESFYLMTEIHKGKQVLKNIKLPYKIVALSEQGAKEVIYADGQFFKFKGQTIDIGYNFLTANNLMERFKPKKEYER